MGRIFETRKATMFARWNKMAKAFTRVSRELTVAAKAGGPDPHTNPILRRAVQNARAISMPRDKIESAIKRAAGKDMTHYEELVYEGYAAHGVAVLVVAMTDNPTRTVANVRMRFQKHGGNMGSTGSVAFNFNQMAVFRVDPTGVDVDELELEMIDHGLEEIGEDADGNIIIRTPFNEYGNMSKALEEKKVEVISAELTWIPSNSIELSEDQSNEVLKMVDNLEQDDDVQKVYHNLK